MSPLIDLYPEQDSDVEVLYEDSPADQEPISFQDVEADPADSESTSEDQS